MKIETPEQTKKEIEIAELNKSVTVRTTCTKYQLVCVLRLNHADLLEALRTAYASSPELQFWWNTVQELDRTNTDFKAAQEALGITDEQVEAIFAEIDEMNIAEA